MCAPVAPTPGCRRSASTPTSGDQFLAFTQFTRSGQANAWYQAKQRPQAAPEPARLGWTWGLDPAITTITYQQFVGSDSDIKLYNWSTNLRHNAPGSVNSDRWEYEPSISGTSLVFARLNTDARPDVRRLYLYDTQSGQRTLLDTFVGKRRAGNLLNGQVNGDWVVWSKMSGGYARLNVYRYRISTGTLELIPRPAGRYDYAPSVTADGTVYFVRSRVHCGEAVRLQATTPTASRARSTTCQPGATWG